MNVRLTQARQSTPAERLAALEKRADAHDLVIGSMAKQVEELFQFWTRLKGFNWVMVKIAAGIGAVLGFLAVLATIAVAIARLWTGH